MGTTNPLGPISSAVCAYDIADIEAAFNGEFKEQAKPNTPWKIVPSSDVPTPRPGTCVKDSKSLSNSHIKFILTHPLMHQEVKPAGGSPIYYTEGAEFTHVIIDKVNISGRGDDRLTQDNITVILAGTSNGKIYKISNWMENNKMKSNLLDIFQATMSKEKIQAMEISRGIDSLYVSSDLGVRAVTIERCYFIYPTCKQCVADPVCGWSRESNTCEKYDSDYSEYTDLLSDPTQTNTDTCRQGYSDYIQDVNATLGGYIHLDCDIMLSSLITVTDIEWSHYHNYKGIRDIKYEIHKFLLTSRSGLIIENLEEDDEGLWACKIDDQTKITFNVTLIQS